MKNALLHICCAVCAAGSIQRLREDGYEVTGFFYNPNIHPEEEYKKRLEAAKGAAKSMGFELIEGHYDKDGWALSVKGLEKEPEGGRRCEVCFKIRLSAAAGLARDKGFGYFATTLSISPYKNTKVINEIGDSLGHGSFLAYDFKKNDGFKRT
ncbi:MAG: epoxyqueuosine reductase QueH, partial [Candidatus Omnitrophica bacterium]|nr:epoxyqueuosine reductase QueH [Candidatus Omnitrophota bacterium]